jgi:histidine ammonia-lyase
MGPIAGRQALQILENVKKVVAIHLLTAKQAVALRKRQFANKVPVQMSAATQALFDELEEIGISTIDEDRFLWQDIDTILDFRPLRF